MKKRKNVEDHQKMVIPEYNYPSLIRSVSHIVNMERRGLVTAEDALDEIVRIYQDHAA